MKSIELKRKVRWCDGDAAGRIYFPRIFDYAGEAEWELLHSVGMIRKKLGDKYDFPRVHVDCSFKKMMEVGARFTLRFWPERLERTSIHYKFVVLLDDEDYQTAAEGSVTVVVLHNGKPGEIPAMIRSGFND